MEHPFAKKEVCGADAKGSFDRSKFGVDKGIPMFKSNVNLSIQIEALLKDEPTTAAQ
jgi:polyisoprenoid-binding protein YceI